MQSTAQQQQKPTDIMLEKKFRNSITRTISSIGSSDSSTRSSCSMIEDDGNDEDEEEQYDIDYLTIKVRNYKSIDDGIDCA
jgi:hypothetical protein